MGAERQIKKKVQMREMVREPREPAGRRLQGSADRVVVVLLLLLLLLLVLLLLLLVLLLAFR